MTVEISEANSGALTRTVTSTTAATADPVPGTAGSSTATKGSPPPKKSTSDKKSSLKTEDEPQPPQRISRKDRIQKANASEHNQQPHSHSAAAAAAAASNENAAELEAAVARNLMRNSSSQSFNGSQRRLAVYVNSDESSLLQALDNNNNNNNNNEEEEKEEEQQEHPSPGSSSRDENPQDPPTLDASESAVDFHFPTTETAVDSTELNPFRILDNNDDPERLEAKIAHFISLRTAGSPFFQANPPAPLPAFETDEVKLGMLLGQGEFGTVREVVEICDKGGHQELPKLLRRLSTQNEGHPHHRQASVDVAFMADSSASSERYRNQHANAGIEAMFEHDDHYEVLDDDDEDDASEASIEIEDIQRVQKAQRARKVLKKRCWREGKARYAVKRLRDDLLDFVRDDNMDYDHQHRTIGAMDLAMEAKLLASFSHPNICKLRGLAGVPGSPDFSLILDRLYMTLDDKIDEWREELKRTKLLANTLSCKGIMNKLFGREKPLTSREASAVDTIRSKTSNPRKFGQSNLVCKKEQLLHRLYAAFDVARALRHLHQHKLLYRDLKPQNIAYDIRGDVRIFDFGLCKELVDRDLLNAPDDYNATGMTGSRRWMAPEVYLCAPYGLSADAFSYGLLLWNLCYLKVPFGNRLTLESHHERVIVKQERPKRLLQKLISDSLWNTMTRCWSVNRAKRPTVEEICSFLRSEILDLREEIEKMRMLRHQGSTARLPAPPSITPPDKQDTATVDKSETQERQSALTRKNTADTVRKSNISTQSSSESERKKGFFGRFYKKKDISGRRKKFKNSKFDAVNTSCHVKGRQKQAQFRMRHNNHSLRQRASRLFHIPRSYSLRRSSLENRSLYLLEKSDRSLDDLQLSSDNINFSMRELHHIHSLVMEGSPPRMIEENN